MRLVFAGSPAAAVPSLRAVAAAGHELLAVVTRADSPQGRRGVVTPTPVASVANELGIQTIKANRLAGEATEQVVALKPDLGVIVAYGGLVREPLLSAPTHGWINLHFSLLPRWRGAAPVQRAIMAGDEITGASVFQLVPELDAGDVFGQLTEPIGRFQTAGGLLESLSASGAELLVRVIDAIADGTARAEPQAGDVTLAPKLDVADGVIDWAHPADRVADLIRGVTPEPGASTTVDGARLKILSAVIARESLWLAPGQLAFVDRTVLVGTTTDPIELVQVQPAGRNQMDAGSWWRGRPADAGMVAS
ncbi:MAG: methionyl-tRNA formyltransferase [Rhodoglobus sp.]